MIGSAEKGIMLHTLLDTYISFGPPSTSLWLGLSIEDGISTPRPHATRASSALWSGLMQSMT